MPQDTIAINTVLAIPGLELFCFLTGPFLKAIITTGYCNDINLDLAPQRLSRRQ
jgi:hypothetical protein